MKIAIYIPKEFEQHFNQDRFEDTLHRLSADAHLLAGNYEQETAIMLINAFQNGTPLPKKHDRLVEVCKVWSALYDMFDNLDMGMVHDALAKAPTILEATEDR